jgi:hypothetical protein
VAYNRRDLIGHWIEKRQQVQKPCSHACCRGYRVHPDNYPTVLPSRTLRRASDHDLGQHWDKVSRGDTEADRQAVQQILHEMERRDAENDRKRRMRESVSRHRAARKQERDAEEERIYREAEDYTRGNWTNKAGRRIGVTDREILTGREAVFYRYASEEARAYFLDHPRPTGAYFRGKDTRMAGRYTERPRRRRAA